MAIPRYTRAEILQRLIDLFPRGPVWPKHPTSNLAKVLTPVANIFHKVTERAADLPVQMSPWTTTELIPEWEKTLGLPSDCAPNETFSRPGPATYVNELGALVRVGNNMLRTVGGREIVEPAATNLLRNPLARGAVANGALPTYWDRFTTNVTVTVLGNGVESGFSYVDLRITGSQPTGVIRIPFEAPTAITAANGDKRVLSWFHRVVSETAGRVTTAQCIVEEINAGVVRTIEQNVTAPTTGAIGPQRAVAAHTLQGATTAWARPAARWFFVAGADGTIDIVLRIANPQYEAGTVATTPIYPWTGTALVASSRVADDRYVATVEERRGRISGRLLADSVQNRIDYVSLAAQFGITATITEFAPMRCGMNRCGEARLYPVHAIHSVRISYPAGTDINAFVCEVNRIKPAHVKILYKAV